MRYRPKSFTLHTGSSIGGHYRNISVQADGRLVLADDWSTREAPLKTPKYTELIDTDVNKNATLCIYERTPLP